MVRVLILFSLVISILSFNNCGKPLKDLSGSKTSSLTESSFDIEKSESDNLVNNNLTTSPSIQSFNESGAQSTLFSESSLGMERIYNCGENCLACSYINSEQNICIDDKGNPDLSKFKLLGTSETILESGSNWVLSSSGIWSINFLSQDVKAYQGVTMHQYAYNPESQLLSSKISISIAAIQEQPASPTPTPSPVGRVYNVNNVQVSQFTIGSSGYETATNCGWNCYGCATAVGGANQCINYDGTPNLASFIRLGTAATKMPSGNNWTMDVHDTWKINITSTDISAYSGVTTKQYYYNPDTKKMSAAVTVKWGN
ncbi:MAG: hypothetical protein KDD50_08880 [Bdellovibrionales bacterium]|nr:hypothetical protein [Bdellovibrionales bacterium]